MNKKYCYWFQHFIQSHNCVIVCFQFYVHVCVCVCMCEMLFLVFTVAAGYTRYEIHMCSEYKCWFCKTIASWNNNTLWIKQKYKSETTTQSRTFFLKKKSNRMEHMASRWKYQRLFRINMNIWKVHAPQNE